VNTTVATLDRSASTAATTVVAVGAAASCVAFAGLQIAMAVAGLTAIAAGRSAGR
jgi:uncharacterized protein (DUF2062 family)